MEEDQGMSIPLVLPTWQTVLGAGRVDIFETLHFSYFNHTLQ